MTRSAWICCGLFFGAGTMFGAGTLVIPFSQAVRAAAADRETLEKAYDELNQKVTALQEGSQMLGRVAHLATPSVVHIESKRDIPNKGTVEETGSGVIVQGVTGQGTYVVTNRHVIEGAIPGNILIALYDGRVLHPEDIRQDKDTDIAVMRIPSAGVTPAKWGDSDQVDIGNMVLAVGSPFGLSQSVTFGIISAKGRRKLKLGSANVLNQDFLQTDAAINPGNSGGPLIDLHGRVIGINTAIASSSGGNEGIGFSIPCNLVHRVMEQLLEYGVVQRAYLGVRLDPSFDQRSAGRLKLDRPTGARVTEVYPNTPAARANLQYDDVVLSFDGVDVEDENHLINLVSLTPFGKQVRIVIWRGGTKQPVIVQLTDRAQLSKESSAVPQPNPGTPIRPMGFRIRQLDNAIREAHRLPGRAGGVIVADVSATSDLVGQLEPGDLIVSVASRPVQDVADLLSAVALAGTERPMALTVNRLEGGQPTEKVVYWHKQSSNAQ